MADVVLYKSGATHPSSFGNVKLPYLVEFDIDFAAAAAKKGSALTAADVLKGIYIPAGTVVLGAGVVKKTALTGTVSVATLDVGEPVADPDEWVDGFDVFAAAVGANGALTASNGPFFLFNTANSIDVTIATLTGTLTGGVVGVWALLLDVAGDKPGPTIAQLGS